MSTSAFHLLYKAFASSSCCWKVLIRKLSIWPMLVTIMFFGLKIILLQGTRHPSWASKTFSPTARIRVDFPAPFAPDNINPCLTNRLFGSQAGSNGCLNSSNYSAGPEVEIVGKQLWASSSKYSEKAHSTSSLAITEKRLSKYSPYALIRPMSFW